MGISENAAYLKGLFEGYEIDAKSGEGKIISKMIELLSDMADKINALEAENRELQEYVEELDHDLGEVEEDFYFDGDEDDDYEGEESEYYELECPSCGEMVCFDETLDSESLVCPACGEKMGGVELCDGDCSACDDEDCKSEQ